MITPDDFRKKWGGNLSPQPLVMDDFNAVVTRLETENEQWKVAAAMYRGLHADSEEAGCQVARFLNEATAREERLREALREIAGPGCQGQGYCRPGHPCPPCEAHAALEKEDTS